MGCFKSLSIKMYSRTILKVYSKAKIKFLRIKRVIMVTFKTCSHSQYIIQNHDLQVVFIRGIAHGPARRFSARGQLTWIGRYRFGSPFGLCWKTGDGRGWSCGTTDSLGRISDSNAIYLYPNLHSALQGDWFEDRMKVKNI